MGVKSRTITIPPPTDGWNTRDPLSDMKPNFSVVLDNLIPRPGGIEGRTGNVKHAGAVPGRINSLMVYTGASGARRLFAASGAEIFDVTSPADVDPDAPDVDSLNSDQFSWTMFGNAGGNYLAAVNGTDPYRTFDGTTWATQTITGVTSADLIYTRAHAERLWFIEKQSQNAWYLDVDAISGTATKFPLGSMLNYGGSLLVMESWTRDGGQGADDVAVFITTEGEVVLFSGTDPSSADTWQRVGVFKIPPPVGRRCTIKLGSDLGIITSQGIIPLSAVLTSPQSEANRLAITNLVEGAFNTAYQSAGAVLGWQIIEYPRKQLMIVNVPSTSGTTFEQFVMVTGSGAWCRFTNLDATCWALMGDDMYFGTVDGRVMRISDDYLDDGTPIQADALPAFFDYKSSMVKRFLLAKPQLTAADGTDPPIEFKVDYDTTPASVAQTAIPSGGSPWGSPWYSPWGPPILSIGRFQSVTGYGVVGSPRMKIAFQTRFKWHETTVTYEVGGPF